MCHSLTTHLVDDEVVALVEPALAAHRREHRLDVCRDTPRNNNTESANDGGASQLAARALGSVHWSGTRSIDRSPYEHHLVRIFEGSWW